MQKSRLNDRHYTRDYGRQNRDRPGGHCPTPIRMDGWKEYLRPEGRSFCKRQEAKARRRANKLLIAEELMMFWEQIAEEQNVYEDEDDWYYYDDYLEENMCNGAFCYPEEYEPEEEYLYDDWYGYDWDY